MLNKSWTSILGVVVSASLAAAACPGDCPVPGGGSPKTDCIVEMSGVTLNAPPNKPKAVDCADGDPACDEDVTPNGSCLFRLSICFNNTDPRFPLCTPTNVASIEVKNKPIGKPKFDPQLAALQDAAIDLGIPTAASACSAPTVVSVPLKVTKKGVYKKGKKKVKLKAITSGNAKDTDNLKLTCLPAAGVTGPGTVARARVISDPRDLIDGVLSRGKAGDIRLFNDRIQVVIQQPGRSMFGIGTYGGNIVDADLDRPLGDERDNFEELAAAINIEGTANYTSVVVLNDGTNGQPAVVRATGLDDLLDFVNPSTVVNSFGPFFPASRDDRDLPIDVQTDYILEPGERYVRIETTIHNLGALAFTSAGAPSDPQDSLFFGEWINASGQVEQFQVGYGFGEPLITKPWTPFMVGPTTVDPANFIAWSGEGDASGVSYGYIHEMAGTTTFSTSGVIVPLLGRPVFETLLGTQHGVVSLAANGQPGDAVTVTRYFAVGDGSVGAIADIRNEIDGYPVGTVEGTVTSGGQPVADADVAVIAPNMAGDPGGYLTTNPSNGVDTGISGNVVDHFRTGPDGRYRGTLVPGSYLVYAQKDGRLFGTPDPLPPDEPTNLTITQNATTTLDFTLPAAGSLSVTVKDENDAPIPAKIQLVGFNAGADPVVKNEGALNQLDGRSGPFGELFEDGLSYGIAHVMFKDVQGSVMEEVEPGDYQVVVSRGPRYSIFTQNVTISPGSITTVNAQIAEVVDTPGFISGDFHIHGINSPDAQETLVERVQTHLAEGIDFMAPSEHDIRVDYQPTIDAMGAGSLIGTCVNAEITTFDYGHFNSWPVTRDGSQPNGGSVDHGRAGVPAGQDFPSLGNYSLTPAEIITAAHADPMVNLVQINHVSSFFGPDGLDIDTAEGSTGPPQSHTPGGLRRLNPGVGNYWSDTFDSLELWIGTDGRGGMLNTFLGRNIGDWFNLLNYGILRSAVTDSDTHQRRNTQVNARSYVASSVTDPGSLSDESENIAASVVAGKLIGTNAPFVTITVAASSTGESGGLGVGQATIVSTTDNQATVTLNIESPIWAEFDRVELYVNHPPQPYDDDANPATRMRYRLATPEYAKSAPADFTITTVNDHPSIPGASHFEATVVFNVAVTQDAWVVALVRGTDGVSRPLFPVYPNDITTGAANDTLAELTDGNLGQSGMTALAFTNPIYIDANDDDDFDPPGVMLTPP